MAFIASCVTEKAVAEGQWIIYWLIQWKLVEWMFKTLKAFNQFQNY